MFDWLSGHTTRERYCGMYEVGKLPMETDGLLYARDIPGSAVSVEMLKKEISRILRTPVMRKKVTADSIVKRSKQTVPQGAVGPGRTHSRPVSDAFVAPVSILASHFVGSFLQVRFNAEDDGTHVDATTEVCCLYEAQLWYKPLPRQTADELDQRSKFAGSPVALFGQTRSDRMLKEARLGMAGADVAVAVTGYGQPSIPQTARAVSLDRVAVGGLQR